MTEGFILLLSRRNSLLSLAWKLQVIPNYLYLLIFHNHLWCNPDMLHYHLNHLEINHLALSLFEYPDPSHHNLAGAGRPSPYWLSSFILVSFKLLLHMQTSRRFLNFSSAGHLLYQWKLLSGFPLVLGVKSSIFKTLHRCIGRFLPVSSALSCISPSLCPPSIPAPLPCLLLLQGLCICCFPYLELTP